MIMRMATRSEVRLACTGYHYLHRIPVYTLAFDFFNDNGDFCGVITYGYPCRMLHKSMHIMQGECLDLNRVALNGLQAFTSECVAMTIRHIKKTFPHVRLLVSYADLTHGHIGTIYQACNWSFIRKTKPERVYFNDGVEINHRTVTGRCMDTRKLEKGWSDSKLLYAYALDKQTKKVVDAMRIPYLKQKDLKI